MKKTLLTMFMVCTLTVLAGGRALALTVGELAPVVPMANQDGKDINLEALRGKFVLLYFYPKDETSGCTVEADTLRDNYAQLKELNTVVFGVSRQDGDSHKGFIKKEKLPFDLLVDVDGKITKAFAVPTIPLVGYSHRQSVLIGPDGKIAKLYTDVDPKSHASQVLADVKSLGAKAAPNTTK